MADNMMPGDNRGADPYDPADLEDCPTCEGTGSDDGCVCPACHGAGAYLPEHDQSFAALDAFLDQFTGLPWRASRSK